MGYHNFSLMSRSVKVVLTFLVFVMLITLYLFRHNRNINQIEIEQNELDIVYGVDEAPITIYIFTNYSCKFCRNFFRESFPRLKDEFIDTKKIRLIVKLVDLTNTEQVKKSLMLSVCINQSGNVEPLDRLLFAEPSVIYTTEFAKLIIDFIDENEYIAECMLSGRAEKYILSNNDYYKHISLTGTPTFIINNKIYKGYKDYESIREVILKEL